MLESINLFNSNYSLVRSEAANSYGILPTGSLEIGKGKKVSRLNLSGGLFTPAHPAATAAHVYIETIEKDVFGAGIKEWILSKMDKRFVRASYQHEGNTQTIFVNVNSLSKRLGITAEAIYLSIKEGNLEQLVKKAQKSYQEREQKVFTLYQQTMRSYLVSSDENQLYTSDRRSNTGMSPQTLYKLIGLSLALSDSEDSFIQVEGRKVLFQKRGEQTTLIHFSDSTIGEGCFGQVKRVTNVWNGTTHVAKLAADPSMGDEIKNEFFLLNFIHSKGNVTGIQRAPLRVFDFKTGNTSQIGYIAPLYDSDLADWPFSEMPWNYQLDCAHQLLEGLSHCSSKNICIGDIKPNNCLIKATKTKKGLNHECVLSDFGFAKQVSTAEGIDIGWAGGAPEYVCAQDCQEFKKLREKVKGLLKKGHRQEAQPILEEMIKIQKARDVYALGLTFSKLFNINRLPARLGNQVEALISQMTCSDYIQRLSAEQALQELKKLPTSVRLNA